MQNCECCLKEVENLVYTNCVLGEYALCAVCNLKLHKILKDHVIDKSKLTEADLEEMNFCGGWNTLEHETKEEILYIEIVSEVYVDEPEIENSYINTFHFCKNCFLEYLNEF
jgi:hypothetical protein